MANLHPAAGTHRDYRGLLIPEIWSPRVLNNHYETAVLTEIANTDYEGEIRGQGDTVNIRRGPNITIKPYQVGQTLDTEVPEVNKTQLVIDKGFYWNFLVEDVDRAQADLEYMQMWTQDAGERLTEATNELVLGEVYADVDAANAGATAGKRTGYFNLGAAGAPVAVTPENVVGKISEWAAVLNEAKAPSSDRWAVIPPWFAQSIYESPYNQALIKGGDQEMYRKGFIGEVAGIRLFTSNQLAMVNDGTEEAPDMVTNIIFGQKEALTYAAQLTESETMRSESQFGTKARGLHVFGFEVVQPNCMGVLYCKRGS